MLPAFGASPVTSFRCSSDGHLEENDASGVAVDCLFATALRFVMSELDFLNLHVTEPQSNERASIRISGAGDGPIVCASSRNQPRPGGSFGEANSPSPTLMPPT